MKRKHFIGINFIDLLDECDQENECDCDCSRKFHNDNHHQYLLSTSYRLLSNKRLDLIALMQHDLFSDLPIQTTKFIRRNESSPFVSVSCRKLIEYEDSSFQSD